MTKEEKAALKVAKEKSKSVEYLIKFLEINLEPIYDTSSGCIYIVDKEWEVVPL